MTDLWSNGFGGGKLGEAVCSRCGAKNLTRYVLKNDETVCKDCYGFGSAKFLSMEGSWNSAMRRDQFDISPETMDDAKVKLTQSTNRAMIKRLGGLRKPQRERINIS